MRLLPAPELLIVREDEAIVGSRSKIIIPDSVERSCARIGIVMAVGEAPEGYESFRLVEGDMIMFHIHQAMPIKLDGEDFHSVHWNSVIGKIKM